MIWVTVILGALSLLLQWLMSRKMGVLTDDQKKKLNNLVFKQREVEGACVSLGCQPGGVPSEEVADNPQALFNGLVSLGAEIDPRSFVKSAASTSLPTTREELRDMILQGIAGIEDHPFFLTREQKALLEAERIFWTKEDGTALDKVLALLGS